MCAHSRCSSDMPRTSPPCGPRGLGFSAQRVCTATTAARLWTSGAPRRRLSLQPGGGLDTPCTVQQLVSARCEKCRIRPRGGRSSAYLDVELAWLQAHERWGLPIHIFRMGGVRHALSTRLLLETISATPCRPAKSQAEQIKAPRTHTVDADVLLSSPRLASPSLTNIVLDADVGSACLQACTALVGAH